MKKRTLGFKLISGGIIAVVVPLLVIGTFSVIKAASALNSVSKEQVTNIATDLASMVNIVLNEDLKIVTELGSATEAVTAVEAIRQNGIAGAQVEIQSLNRKLTSSMKTIGKDFESILVSDRVGNIVADGDNGNDSGISISDRDYFRVAQNGTVNVGEPVSSKVTGNPVIPVCTPIKGADGSVIGTLVVTLKTDSIADIILGVKVGDTGYPFMVDQTGLTIIHPNDEHILTTNLAKTAGMEVFMQRMLNNETGVDEYVFEGVHKIAGFAPVKLTGWGIGVTQPSSEFLAAANAIRNVLLIVGLIFLTITVVAVVFFARSITNPINSVIIGLTEGSEQVASASGQVSAASQQLAEGSSELAASIEETSSSVEEIASMARQNADNSNQAKQLMQNISAVVEKVNGQMNDLVDATDMISKSSEETSKIIKTIDEIAFQTNLLALNAAVEAARAGEAGAGFAVVADEVRNLAMRAADAAKTTAELIQNTINAVNNGTQLTKTAQEGFRENAEIAGKVGKLIDEVAAASNEQSQGLDQINSAVSQMDSVTQTTAANAEESASASEELTSQASELNNMVETLINIVGGSGGHQNQTPQLGGATIKKSGKSFVTKSRPALTAGRSFPKAQVSAHSAPSDVIPLEDDFETF